MTESDTPSFEKDQPPSFDKQPPQLPAGYPPGTPYGQPGHGSAPGYGPPPGYPPQYGFAPALPPQLKPSSNIGWAIGAIFTFWPLAIPAFIFATKVDDLWFRGDRAGAEKASHDARLYGMIGVIIGVVLFVIGILIFIFVFVVFANAVDHINDISPTYVDPSNVIPSFAGPT